MTAEVNNRIIPGTLPVVWQDFFVTTNVVAPTQQFQIH
jgi:hypothetical protein